MSTTTDKPVIVITGASSGFGKGVALRFAGQGASLVVAARRVGLLEELARECEAMEAVSLPVEADVSQQADVERVAQTAISTFGRIDVWINNAGVAAIGRFEDVPLGDHVQVIGTDLLGTMFGSFVALQQFRRQRQGTLINVASALGKFPVPYYASYTAAKHGVVGFSAALRQEIRQNHDDQIHVCTVLPMAMDTPFFQHASNYTGREAVPVPPLNDPTLVIDAIVRLAKTPEDEVLVGWGGHFANFAHSLFPGLTEDAIAKRTHQSQIEQANEAEMTSGAVHTPISAGTDVSGGLLKN